MFFDLQILNVIFVMFVWCAVVFLWVYGFVQEDRENVFFKFTTRINIHRKVLSRKPLHHVKVTFHAGDFATLNNT